MQVLFKDDYFRKFFKAFLTWNYYMYAKFNTLKKHHQLLASLVIAIALISIWRGIWRLFDYYVFPDHFVLSSLITLVLGICILIITHHKLS